MYYCQKKQSSKANAQYTPCIIYAVVCEHSCVTHNSKFINDNNSYKKFDFRLKFLTYCSRFILNFLCMRAMRPKEPAKVNSKLTWKKNQPVTYIMYMYIKCCCNYIVFIFALHITLITHYVNYMYTAHTKIQNNIFLAPSYCIHVQCTLEKDFSNLLFNTFFKP